MIWRAHEIITNPAEVTPMTDPQTPAADQH